MNDRQYFRGSVGDLEVVVKNSWHSLESLHTVVYELNFRRTPRATWLQCRVERRIQELNQAKRKANQRQTEHVEVQGIVNRFRVNSAVLKSLIEKTVKETIQRHRDQQAIRNAEVAKKRSFAQIARREREAEIKAEKARSESTKQEALSRLYLSGDCSQVRQIEYLDSERKQLTGFSCSKVRCRSCGRHAVPSSDTCYSCS